MEIWNMWVITYFFFYDFYYLHNKMINDKITLNKNGGNKQWKNL